MVVLILLAFFERYGKIMEVALSMGLYFYSVAFIGGGNMEWMDELQELAYKKKKKKAELVGDCVFGLMLVILLIIGVRLFGKALWCDAVLIQIENATEQQDYETLASLEKPPWSFGQCVAIGVGGFFMVVLGSVFATGVFVSVVPSTVQEYKDITRDYEWTERQLEKDIQQHTEYSKTHFVGDDKEEQRKHRIREELEQLVIVDSPELLDNAGFLALRPITSEEETVNEKVRAIIERLQKFNDVQNKQRHLITQYNATYLESTEVALDRMESRLYDKIEIVLFRHERAPSEHDEFLSMLSELPDIIDKDLSMAEELYDQSVAMAELNASSKHSSDEAQIAAWTETLKEEVAKKTAETT